MVSIGAMYTMGNGFTDDYPPRRKNYREHVGRCERTEEGVLAVRKREIKAEDREFVFTTLKSRISNSPGSSASWREEAALRRMRLLCRLVRHLPNPLIPDCVFREFRSMLVLVWRK